MASAKSFVQVGFHGYQDLFFQGSVQNLFYPPLQDFLLSRLYLILKQDYLLSFKIYLSALIGLFFFSVVYTAKQIQSNVGRCMFIAFSLILINSKEQLLGLSHESLVAAGLSPNLLGGIFFLLFVSEMIGKQRAPFLAVLLFLAVISHIVMGLVVVVLAGVLILEKRRAVFFWPFFWSVLATSFFIGPLIWHRKYLLRDTLIEPRHETVFVFSILGLFLFRKFQTLRLLFIASIVLLGTIVLSQSQSFLWWKIWPGFTLPPFHFYRFAMPALFVLATSISLIPQTMGTGGTRKVRFTALCFCGLSFFVLTSTLNPPTTKYFSFKPSNSLNTVLKAAPISNSPNSQMSRTWVLQHKPVGGHAVASYLGLLNNNVRFNTGLFFESSRNNLLTSSYLDSIFGAGYYSTIFSGVFSQCGQIKCLFDSLIRLNGLEGLILPETASIEFSESGLRDSLSEARAHCLDSALAQGTDKFTFKELSSFYIDKARYRYFKITPKKSAPGYNQFVEPILPNQLIRYDGTDRKSYRQGVFQLHAICSGHSDLDRTALMEDGPFKSLFDELKNGKLVNSVAPVFGTRLRSGEYLIEVLGDAPSLFKVKLSFFPGMRFEQHGKLIPFLEGASGMIGYGKGKIKLIYERPRLFWFFYGLSFVAGIVFIVRFKEWQVNQSLAS